MTREGFPTIIARALPPDLFVAEPLGMERLPLFVFGTLRRGQCNHRLLAGRYLRRSVALLPDFERFKPLMIRFAAGRTVPGELYVLRSELYDRVMRDCDALEGIARGGIVGPEYARKKVRVETPDGPVVAWAYVHPASLRAVQAVAVANSDGAADADAVADAAGDS